MKWVSSIDVARLAGVSQSSVSRVFSPNANVSEEKRERILAAARQLGYKPNALARGLITQSTNLIGVMVADVASLFYASFLSALTHRLRAIGQQVILFNVGLEQTADEVLPTIAQPVEALLAVTMGVLEVRLERDGAFEPKMDLIEGELVLRGSVKK